MNPLKKTIVKRSVDYSYPENQMPCSTVSNLQKREDMDVQKAEVLQYLPEIQKPNQQNPCPSCGGGHTCPHCGMGCPYCLQCGCRPTVTPIHHQARPQYIEYNRAGHQITYNPRHNSYPKETPRFVFDQLGHKYIEDNGNLKILPPDFVSYYQTPAEEMAQEQLYLNKIRHLLYSHPDFHKATMLKNGQLTPSPFEQQRDALKFLRQIVKGKSNTAKHIPLTTIDESSSENKNENSYRSNDNKEETLLTEMKSEPTIPTLTQSNPVDQNQNNNERNVRFLTTLEKNKLPDEQEITIESVPESDLEVTNINDNKNPRGIVFFEEQRNGKKLEIIGSELNSVFKRSEDVNHVNVIDDELHSNIIEDLEKNSSEFIS